MELLGSKVDSKINKSQHPDSHSRRHELRDFWLLASDKEFPSCLRVTAVRHLVSHFTHLYLNSIWESDPDFPFSFVGIICHIR